MGEFSTLYVNDYQVDSWKNSIGYACELFAENDFVETTRIYNDEEEPSPAYQYQYFGQFFNS
jgi:LEA14-like dessication related protein